MSNVVIYLTAGKGYTDSDLSNATIAITGLKTAATLNIASGVVTATGSANNIKPKSETGYFRALVVPQSVSNAALITVTLGDYTYTLTQTINFESNKQYKCTLTVDKIEEGLNIGISAWETSDVDYGGTVK
jgi:archaellin